MRGGLYYLYRTKSQEVWDMGLLTRKQAVIEAAIPQQIEFMIGNGYIPSWGLFKRSTGWEATIENLELTKAEQADYEDRWHAHLLRMKEGSH
jgi:hypothetical protein